MRKPVQSFKKGDRVRVLVDGGGTGTVIGPFTLRWSAQRIQMDVGTIVVAQTWEIEHLSAVDRLAEVASPDDVSADTG